MPGDLTTSGGWVGLGSLVVSPPVRLTWKKGVLPDSALPSEQDIGLACPEIPFRVQRG
jgi:hypothetical protein